MPQRDVRTCLHDVQQASDRIAQVTAPHTLHTYAQDWVVRAAVERQFEIIGEALRRACDIDEVIETRITDCGKIIAFRNQVIHGYDVIDHEIVWGIIERYLPRLTAEVNQLLH